MFSIPSAVPSWLGSEQENKNMCQGTAIYSLPPLWGDIYMEILCDLQLPHFTWLAVSWSNKNITYLPLREKFYNWELSERYIKNLLKFAKRYNLKKMITILLLPVLYVLEVNFYDCVLFPTIQHNQLLNALSGSLGKMKKQLLNTGNLKFTLMRRKCQTGSTKLRRENCLLFYIPLKERELGRNRPVAFPWENSRQTQSQFRYQSCRPPTPIIHQGSFSAFQSFAATNNGAVERMFRMRLLLVTASRATL